jgi:hypothetical protein
MRSAGLAQIWVMVPKPGFDCVEEGRSFCEQFLGFAFGDFSGSVVVGDIALGAAAVEVGTVIAEFGYIYFSQGVKSSSVMASAAGSVAMAAEHYK